MKNIMERPESIWDALNHADGNVYKKEGRHLRLTEKAALAFLILEHRLFDKK